MELELKLKVLKSVAVKLSLMKAVETSECEDYSICRRLHSAQKYWGLSIDQLTNLINEMHERMSHTEIVWVNDRLKPTQVKEIFKAWTRTNDKDYYLWHPNDFKSRYSFLSAWINEIEEELDKR